MNNPWEEISLDNYEKHMSLNSVKQLQALDRIMKDQWEAYPVKTVMLLGIAGGNGLRHIRDRQFDAVYGVDINRDYLNTVKKRYDHLSGILQCLHLDLMKDADKLPGAEYVIADLLIEYIGYPAFRNVIRQVSPRYVSCVIQINSDEEQWVSESPYIHAFDGLDAVHHQIDETGLTRTMEEAGFAGVFQGTEALPNGKKLLRLDFSREEWD